LVQSVRNVRVRSNADLTTDVSELSMDHHLFVCKLPLENKQGLHYIQD